MKKIAIMQPYLFPYIGYFQLIHAVDTFIVLDNVQYINRGWINRNRILLNQEPYLFSFSVKSGARDLSINQRYYSEARSNEIAKFEKTLYYAYNKAPNYEEVIDLLKNIEQQTVESNVAISNTTQLQLLIAYLGIETQFQYASEIKERTEESAEQYLISICKAKGSENYVNPLGGQSLYSKTAFSQNGIILNFIQTKPYVYSQLGKVWVPHLSIIDVMMFNTKEQIRELLGQYELV